MVPPPTALLLDEPLDEDDDSFPLLDPDSEPLLLGLELVVDLDESLLLVLSLLLLFLFLSSEVVEDGRSSELDDSLDRVPLSSWLSTSFTGRPCLFCAGCVCEGKDPSPLGLLGTISPEQLGQTEQAPKLPAFSGWLLSADCFRSMLPEDIELLTLSALLSEAAPSLDDELDAGSRSLRMRILSSWKK